MKVLLPITNSDMKMTLKQLIEVYSDCSFKVYSYDLDSLTKKDLSLFINNSLVLNSTVESIVDITSYISPKIKIITVMIDGYEFLTKLQRLSTDNDY